MSLKVVFVKDLKSFKLKDPVMVVGFPGVGLVGSIAATYLSNLEDFELAGTVESDKLAPVAAVHDYKPLPPIRFLVSKEKNLVVALSEASIPMSISLSLSNLIFKIAEDLECSFIVSIGGMASATKGKRSAYYIASTERSAKFAKKMKLGEQIREGATSGLTAQLITKAHMADRDMIAILVDAAPEVGDPIASSASLKLLSRLINYRIPTAQLDQEAKEFEKSISEAALQSVSSSDYSMYG